MWLCEMAPCEPTANESLWLSPQLTFTVHGLSAVPGSENEPRLNDLFSPSSEVWLAGAVTVGLTLFTVTEVVYWVNPPSLSMIRALTVYVPLSTKEQGNVAEVPARA